MKNYIDRDFMNLIFVGVKLSYGNKVPSELGNNAVE